MPKFSATEIALLATFAGAADVLTLIPAINTLVSLGVTPALYCCFKVKGVRAYPTIIAGVIEIFPIISTLPAITGGVLAVVIMDGLGNKLPVSAASPPKDIQENTRQRKLNAQQDLRNEEQRQAQGYGDPRPTDTYMATS